MSIRTRRSYRAPGPDDDGEVVLIEEQGDIDINGTLFITSRTEAMVSDADELLVSLAKAKSDFEEATLDIDREISEIGRLRRTPAGRA